MYKPCNRPRVLGWHFSADQWSMSKGRHLAMSLYKLKASVIYLTELSTSEPLPVYTFHWTTGQDLCWHCFISFALPNDPYQLTQRGCDGRKDKWTDKSIVKHTLLIIFVKVIHDPPPNLIPINNYFRLAMWYLNLKIVMFTDRWKIHDIVVH
jgi:hypothetical protein